MKAELEKVDLAALRTLRLVFRRGSFTEAAAELDVNQSTVSYTIDRLRRAFDDPLFVRQGARVAATERCQQVVEVAQLVLSEIERAAAPPQFEPAEITADVTVSATYLSRSVLIPPLMRHVRRTAPGIRIEMITGFTDAKDHLLSGRADVALTPVKIEESGIYGKRLLRSPYVCVMDSSNPLSRGKLSLDEFRKARHLVISYGAGWRPIYLQQLDSAGEAIDVVASTPDPADLLHIMPGTDLICALPELIARQFEPSLSITACPLPAVTEISMYWPARLNRSPLNTWLRGLIEEGAKVAGTHDQEL